MTMKISSKLTDLIKENRSFLIVGHINPEGDSIGSCLALARGLSKIGKNKVHVLSRDPVPETLRFLPSSHIIKQTLPRGEFDVVFLVDCNDPSRTGFQNFKSQSTAIIDHHVVSPETASTDFHRSVTASVIDPDAAATGVLIYKLLISLKIPIDRDIATNLYTAILVDTGGFRYANSSPESLEIASHLVESGARPWSITKEVYENIPFRSVKLLGLSLATLESNNGIAWMVTTKSMLKKTGATSEDCEDFVDYPRKVKGIEVAVFFRQDSLKSFKVSLRSKGNIDVQKIAKTFRGGGHIAAAGCKVNGTLEEVKSKLFRAVRTALKEHRR